MKNLLFLFITTLLLAGCSNNAPSDETELISLTGAKYVCGEVNVINSEIQIGVITVSENHDDSYKVFYDSKSFDEANTKINPYDEVCFKVETIRGVPFAKSILPSDQIEKNQLYDKGFTSSLSVHEELDHDMSDMAHRKTHIEYDINSATGAKTYFAFKDQRDTFATNVPRSQMTQVLIPNIYQARIDTASNRVFYSEWSTPATHNGVTVTPLNEISKCHSHGSTRRICIPN